jgi:hypothetical protein
MPALKQVIKPHKIKFKTAMSAGVLPTKIHDRSSKNLTNRKEVIGKTENFENGVNVITEFLD